MQSRINCYLTPQLIKQIDELRAKKQVKSSNVVSRSEVIRDGIEKFLKEELRK